MTACTDKCTSLVKYLGGLLWYSMSGMPIVSTHSRLHRIGLSRSLSFQCQFLGSQGSSRGSGFKMDIILKVVDLWWVDMVVTLEYTFIGLTRAIDTLERVVTIHILEACVGQCQFIIKLTEVSGIKKIVGSLDLLCSCMEGMHDAGANQGHHGLVIHSPSVELDEECQDKRRMW